MPVHVDRVRPQVVRDRQQLGSFLLEHLFHDLYYGDYGIWGHDGPRKVREIRLDADHVHLHDRRRHLPGQDYHKHLQDCRSSKDVQVGGIFSKGDQCKITVFSQLQSLNSMFKEHKMGIEIVF